MSISEPKAVVCAVDFSEGSEAALFQAADYAERLHGRLHLLHSDPVFGSEYGHVEQKGLKTETLEKRVREFASHALGGADVLDVVGPKIVVRSGVYAGDAILDYAGEADASYIVLGTHGRRGVRRFIVGSVAEYVVRGSFCPVLTVPLSAAKTQPGPNAPIVVPVDFSDHSRQALIHAKEMSREFSAPIHMVHVLEDSGVIPGFYLAGGLVPVHDLPNLNDFADDHLRQLDDEVGGEPAADFHVRAGRAHREIPACAEDVGAGLIVMATHGLTGIKHAVVGSVTERTLRYVHCPVLSLAVKES